MSLIPETLYVLHGDAMWYKQQFSVTVYLLLCCGCGGYCCSIHLFCCVCLARSPRACMLCSRVMLAWKCLYLRAPVMWVRCGGVVCCIAYKLGWRISISWEICPISDVRKTRFKRFGRLKKILSATNGKCADTNRNLIVRYLFARNTLIFWDCCAHGTFVPSSAVQHISFGVEVCKLLDPPGKYGFIQDTSTY